MPAQTLCERIERSATSQFGYFRWYNLKLENSIDKMQIKGILACFSRRGIRSTGIRSLNEFGEKASLTQFPHPYWSRPISCARLKIIFVKVFLMYLFQFLVFGVLTVCAARTVLHTTRSLRLGLFERYSFQLLALKNGKWCDLPNDLSSAQVRTRFSLLLSTVTVK